MIGFTGDELPLKQDALSEVDSGTGSHEHSFCRRKAQAVEPGFLLRVSPEGSEVETLRRISVLQTPAIEIGCRVFTVVEGQIAHFKKMVVVLEADDHGLQVKRRFVFGMVG